jgi:hypothetical protein
MAAEEALVVIRDRGRPGKPSPPVGHRCTTATPIGLPAWAARRRVPALIAHRSEVAPHAQNTANVANRRQSRGIS